MVTPLLKNRHALLIACTSYRDSNLRQLASPGADVRELAVLLSDPDVGGFTVTLVINKTWWAVQRAIARFFANRNPEDVLLLYFSCHGLKRDDGHLYFAARDTDRSILRASSVPDDFVQEHMRTTRARQQVLILDCCYGGFFTNRMLTKSDATVNDIDIFQAQGAVILTGSTAIQYAFEHEGFEDRSELSVFTSCLVKGLGTGLADLDGDGLISAVELFGYARREMRTVAGKQTPTISTIGQEGEIYIATVPPSKRTTRRPVSFMSPSPDGWIDLTKFLDRSPDAVSLDAVLVAMQVSLAFQGKRISLSNLDLRRKLAKLTKRELDKEGFVVNDMMYVIDHLGVLAANSSKVYTARSFRLSDLDDIVIHLKLGRPVVAGLSWREGWLKEPTSKSGKLDLDEGGQVVGGSMITIVACNQVDMSVRFMWQFGWGDRGLGSMNLATAKTSIHSDLYSIEATEMTELSNYVQRRRRGKSQFNTKS